MKKVTLIGCFAYKHKLYDGQTIKTIMVSNELKKVFGSDEVEDIDTYLWKKSIFELLKCTIRSFKKSENIIMLPAQNGLILFAPLLSVLNLFYNRKIHYVVIGGWLYDYLISKKYIIGFLNNFNGIYVETKKMKENLFKLGFNNIILMPNFKSIEKAKLDFKDHPEGEFRFCTFSRVMKEKGITNAIELVKSLHNKGFKCKLSIFGKIADEYEEEFIALAHVNSEFISYCGMVEPEDSVQVLKQYDAMIFLTEYEGEGFPGTLLDALFAGLPVLATDWKYNNEIILTGRTGFLIKVGEQKKLEECAIKIINDVELNTKMRKYCLEESDRYLSSNVIRCLIERM